MALIRSCINHPFSCQSAKIVTLGFSNFLSPQTKNLLNYQYAIENNLSNIEQCNYTLILPNTSRFSRSFISDNSKSNRQFVLSKIYNQFLPFGNSFGKLKKKCYSQVAKKEQPKHIVETDEKPFSELTFGEKVKRTSKDATYGGIILIGIGVTGLMFYVIGRELFSSQSPSGVYGSTVKLLKKNYDVIDAIGEPMKAYGEMTRRGRRRHVSHLEWEDDKGAKHMRMKFYIEGPTQRKGDVHLEVKQNEDGKFQYRYLFVEVGAGYNKRVIIVEDNR